MNYSSPSLTYFTFLFKKQAIKQLGIACITLFLPLFLNAQTYTMGTAPATNGTTISTCSGTFYDSGGSAGNYGNNQNMVVTFCAATAGSQLRMLFNSIIVAGGDSLRVYNGTNTSAPLLKLYTASSITADTLNSYVGGCLTVWFKSNASTVNAGWNATISCITGCSNTYLFCNGTSINWMETAVGSGVGTMSINNLPNAATYGYYFNRDINGVRTHFLDESYFVVRGCYKFYNIPVGRAMFDMNIYRQSDFVETCSDYRQLDFGCCSLNIKDVSVSNCYLVGGVSKATVCTEVEWSGAPYKDSITLTVGSVTKVIQTNTFNSYIGLYDLNSTGIPPYLPGYLQLQLLSSQQVCVEVNAGTSGAISASFIKAGCNDTDSYTTPSACPITTCSTGILGGTVFEDFNADGTKQAGEYVGVSGITVQVYDKTGALFGTYTTDNNGKYIASVPAASYPVRVEFSGIPTIYGGGYSTLNGTDGRTTVQFVSVADCSVDLGVNNAASYCQNNPLLITPIYKNGDPLLNGTAKTQTTLMGFPLTNSGDPSTHTFSISGENIGTLWGQAYNRKTQNVFSAAFLRRHCGLGPGGLDAIYITNLSNPAAPTTPIYFNLLSKGINVGTISSNAVRGLPADINQPNIDTTDGVYRKICAQGIGGIDISDDGNDLWLINVKNNTLHKLNLATFNNSNNTADITATGTYTLPAMGCVGGIQRSFACKYYKGKVYIGSICDGSTSNKSNMRAAIYEFNPTSSSFTEILNFPLTYPKGPPQTNITADEWEAINGWYIWHNDLELNDAFPQPVLMDIEFDIDGSIVLGFGDRKAFQLGYQNTRADGGGGTESGISGGDILRAVKTAAGDFMLENNGKVAGVAGYGAGNNQGPGFGEFYNDNTLASGGAIYHAETALGGLSILPGSGQVISSHMDPITEPQTVGQWYFSGGVRWYDNQTGNYIKGYQTYITEYDLIDPASNGTMAKAAGMGDIELTCGLPEYIEIGNYVWLDKDKDGVQDAIEPRIAGVNVALYKGAALIATTVTNSNGEFFFNHKYSHIGGTWSGTGADTAILQNTTYSIVFGTNGQYVSSVLNANNKGRMFLTAANTGQGLNSDLNDNDASIQAVAGGNYPTISLTTAAYQYVNHTLDAAFYCDEIDISTTLSQTAPTCTGLIAHNDGKITLIAAPVNATKYRIRLGTNWLGAPDTTFATASNIGTAFPLDIQTNIPNTGGTYIIRFYSGDLCYKDTLITIDAVICVVGSVGNYVWKDSNGNGLNDEPSSAGINGINVQLWEATSNTLISSTTTANNAGNPGYYNFEIITTGNYYLKFPTSTGTFVLTNPTTTAATDGNSDADKLTGKSPIFTIDIHGSGVSKDNPTIDAGYTCPNGCIPIAITKH